MTLFRNESVLKYPLYYALLMYDLKTVCEVSFAINHENKPLQFQEISL